MLRDPDAVGQTVPSFASMLAQQGAGPLTATSVRVLQVNVGTVCNQTCQHCHVDAGPDRRERMERHHLMRCLEIVREHQIPVVDITGGAPEMHPDFRWFVAEASAIGATVMVRSNLTIMLANPIYEDLPSFFQQHRVHVVASLPYFEARHTDRQRGDGVFDASISALQRLNNVGYGRSDREYRLDLVYNPAGAFLPAGQQALEEQYRRILTSRYGVEFHDLIAITNMPIARYLEFLVRSGNLERYMQSLVQAFNPTTISGLMCRDTISIGWDGAIYDCDFNQMLALPVLGTSAHLDTFDIQALRSRPIVVDQHCYGCTAGAGSSCGGQLA